MGQSRTSAKRSGSAGGKARRAAARAGSAAALSPPLWPSPRSSQSRSLDALVARIALEFVRVDHRQLDERLSWALREIGRFAKVDRSYLYLYSDDLSTFDNTHEWVSQGTDPHIHLFRHQPSASLPWTHQQIQKKPLIQIPDTARLPRQAVAEREICRKHHIRSLLLMPLRAGDKLLGLLGFDSEKKRKVWAERDIRLLQVVSAVFGGALQRASAELALRRSKRRLRAILRAMPDRVVIIDRQGLVRHVLPTTTDPSQFRPTREILGQTLSDILQPHQVALARDCLHMALETGKLQNQVYEVFYQGQGRFLDTRYVRLDRQRIMVVIRNISDRIQTEKTLRDQQAKLRRLASELTLAEERQRRQFALELHDGIAQELAMAHNHLRQFRAQCPATVAHDALDNAITLMENALRQTQTLTFDLSPAVLYDLGVPAALRSLGRRIGQQHNLEFKYHQTGSFLPPPRPVQILLFRIARELMINVVKHAHARHLDVYLGCTPQSLTLSVRDDGQGFDVAATALRPDEYGHFGLYSIPERLAPMAGTFAIESQPGRGTTATITVPVTSASDETAAPVPPRSPYDAPAAG